MPVFQYVATDPSGETKRGLEHGPDLAVTADALRSRGLVVREIRLAESSGMEAPRPQAPTESAGFESPRPFDSGPPTEERSRMQTDVLGPLVGGVPLKDLHFFFRQVGTMLHAGVGLAQSLATIATQTSHPKLRRIVEEASQSVVAGRPMTSCFRRYPEVFTDLMMSMIQIGEDGGMLPEQCRRLADYIQRDMEQRNLIRRETAYPKIVLAASIVIILAANALIAMIAPSAPGLSSPLTNPRVWMVLGPLLILGFLAWRYGRHNPEVRRVVQGIGVSLPGLGGTIRGFAMAKFGRALGALYAAGVPIPRALELSADACGNEHVRSRMYPAASALKDGVPLSLALAQTGSVSPLVLEMIRTGEMTGNIDEMLTKTAEYYEDEGALRAKQFATIFGVVVFLAVAVYIASIIIGFYTGHFRSLMSGV